MPFPNTPKGERVEPQDNACILRRETGIRPRLADCRPGPSARWAMWPCASARHVAGAEGIISEDGH